MTVAAAAEWSKSRQPFIVVDEPFIDHHTHCAQQLQLHAMQYISQDQFTKLMRQAGPATQRTAEQLARLRKAEKKSMSVAPAAATTSTATTVILTKKNKVKSMAAPVSIKPRYMIL